MYLHISVIYSLEKGSTPTEEGANDIRVKPATQRDVSEACEMLAPLSYQGNAEKRKPSGKLSKLETLPLEFDSSNSI
jgi:hypothetical protein